MDHNKITEMFRNTITRARPERIIWESEIVDLAIYIAQLLCMDIKIEQQTDYLYIELNFNEMPIMDDLKLKFLTLLGMVDEISFFRPKNSAYDFRISLIYDTFTHFRIPREDRKNTIWREKLTSNPLIIKNKTNL